MTLAKFVHIQCPGCKLRSKVASKWLMASEQCCLNCGVSLVPLQNRALQIVREAGRFNDETRFVMKVESSFGISVSDDDVLQLRTADDIHCFVVDAIKRSGREANSEDIWACLKDLSRQIIGIENLDGATDVLRGLRSHTEITALD